MRHTLLLGLLLAGPAFAQEGPRDLEREHRRRMEELERRHREEREGLEREFRGREAERRRSTEEPGRRPPAADGEEAIRRLAERVERLAREVEDLRRPVPRGEGRPAPPPEAPRGDRRPNPSPRGCACEMKCERCHGAAPDGPRPPPPPPPRRPGEGGDR